MITLHSRTIVTTLVYCSNHTALSIPHYTTLHCPWQAAKWKVGPRQQIIPFSAAIGALWSFVVFVAQSLNDYTAALMIIQQLRPVLFPFGTVLCNVLYCTLYTLHYTVLFFDWFSTVPDNLWLQAPLAPGLRLHWPHFQHITSNHIISKLIPIISGPIHIHIHIPS